MKKNYKGGGCGCGGTTLGFPQMGGGFLDGLFGSKEKHVVEANEANEANESVYNANNDSNTMLENNNTIKSLNLHEKPSFEERLEKVEEKVAELGQTYGGRRVMRKRVTRKHNKAKKRKTRTK